jgi:hypothetical protein
MTEISQLNTNNRYYKQFIKHLFKLQIAQCLLQAVCIKYVAKQMSPACKLAYLDTLPTGPSAQRNLYIQKLPPQ